MKPKQGHLKESCAATVPSSFHEGTGADSAKSLTNLIQAAQITAKIMSRRMEADLAQDTEFGYFGERVMGKKPFWAKP